MTLGYLRVALADIEAIARGFACNNPTTATRVVARIRRANEALQEFPSMGRSGRSEGTREWAVSKLPYLVVYRIVGDGSQIEILRVYHGRRDPESIDIIED